MAGAGDVVTAMAFPGIGPVTFDEIGRFLLVNPVARRLLGTADQTLGYSILDRYRQYQGGYAEHERVAFLVVCLALAYWSEETLEVRADVCTGASFGDTPAAVYSGALEFPEAVWLTARWSDHVTDFFAGEYGDVVTQSFARLSPSGLDEIRAELTGQGEWHDVAAQVSDDFWMLSVRRHRLDWLHRTLRARGAVPLYTMSPPMHSASFAPLRDTIERELLSQVRFSDPTRPLVSDHDGSVLDTGEQVRRLLADGITRPVQWPKTLGALSDLGVQRLCVAGPDALWGRVPSARDRFELLALTPALALRPRSRPRSLLG